MPIPMNLRLILAVQFLLGALPAFAQDAYPSRTVQVVVPYPAGGTVDPLVRIICDRLSRNLGQSFVVLNQPGAGGNTGTASVVRGAHDGYTRWWPAPPRSPSTPPITGI